MKEMTDLEAMALEAYPRVVADLMRDVARLEARLAGCACGVRHGPSQPVSARDTGQSCWETQSNQAGSIG